MPLLSIVLPILTLLVVVALVASADPSNPNLPPTEDWTFDEGATTIIKNKVWTVKYNITVKDGSTLRFEECYLNFVGAVGITSNIGTDLSFKSCDLSSSGGTRGYFIEAHSDLTLVDCELVGLDTNPSGDGGLTAYGADVEMDFVGIHHGRGPASVYVENCQLDMANCQINDSVGDGVVIYVGQNVLNIWYNSAMIDTEFFDIGGDALVVEVDGNAGFVYIDMYNVDILDVVGSGMIVDVGDHTSSYVGHGSVYLDMEMVYITNVSADGVFLSNLYQVDGGIGHNEFQVEMDECILDTIGRSGIRTELVHTRVDFSLRVNSSTIEDTGRLMSTDPQSGILHLWGGKEYDCDGTAKVEVTNSALKGCSPSAVLLLDYGGNDFQFVNDEFSGNIVDCVLTIIKEGGHQSGTRVQGCRFMDNLGFGLRTLVENNHYGVQAIQSMSLTARSSGTLKQPLPSTPLGGTTHPTPVST